MTFDPEKEIRNKLAQKKLEGMLSPKERMERGLVVELENPDLAEFQGIPNDNPAIEINLNFLLKLKAKVEEWERKLTAIDNSPIRGLGDYKALRKEISLARTEHTNNEDLVNLHGAEADKQDLEALKNRIKLIKKALDAAMDSYPKKTPYKRHDDVE